MPRTSVGGRRYTTGSGADKSQRSESARCRLRLRRRQLRCQPADNPQLGRRGAVVSASGILSSGYCSRLPRRATAALTGFSFATTASPARTDPSYEHIRRRTALDIGRRRDDRRRSCQFGNYLRPLVAFLNAPRKQQRNCVLAALVHYNNGGIPCLILHAGAMERTTIPVAIIYSSTSYSPKISCVSAGVLRK